MADNNNNDVINSILNELDKKKNEPKPPVEDIPRQVERKAPEVPEEPARRAVPQHERPVVKHERPSEEQHRVNGGAPASAARPVHNYDDSPVPMRSRSAVKRNNAYHKQKKKKKKRRRSRLPGVLILTVFIFAVSICLSLVIIAFGRDMYGIGKSDTTHLITVPENATVEEISELLHQEGIINSPKCFQLFSKFRKTPDVYKAGEHFVSPSMAYETLINTLTNEEQEQQKDAVTLTFPEGITLYDAAEKLQENEVCKADEFIFYFNAGGYGFRFEDELTKTPNVLRFSETRMEGYLFPDTYTFTKDMKPEQVCQKIYFNFDNKMTDERLAKMKKLGLTLDQLIILSSIVQKETYNRPDMNHVASVFWNRLEHTDAETVGMLQSDPTKNYAYDTIRTHMTVMNNDIINAYDTYTSAGLPPGAICNPGLDAIDAVLEKMPSDDYYFIANLYTKETFFSKTNDEHEQRKAQVKADEAQYKLEQEQLEAEAADE